jgi:hypothetical protein
MTLLQPQSLQNIEWVENEKEWWVHRDFKGDSGLSGATVQKLVS